MKGNIKACLWTWPTKTVVHLEGNTNSQIHNKYIIHWLCCNKMEEMCNEMQQVNWIPIKISSKKIQFPLVDNIQHRDWGYLLHIDATRLAVKSLSSQWLSVNLLPNLLATRQVTIDGINWCSWSKQKLEDKKFRDCFPWASPQTRLSKTTLRTTFFSF